KPELAALRHPHLVLSPCVTEEGVAEHVCVSPQLQLTVASAFDQVHDAPHVSGARDPRADVEGLMHIGRRHPAVAQRDDERRPLVAGWQEAPGVDDRVLNGRDDEPARPSLEARPPVVGASAMPLYARRDDRWTTTL